MVQHYCIIRKLICLLISTDTPTKREGAGWVGGCIALAISPPTAPEELL